MIRDGVVHCDECGGEVEADRGFWLGDRVICRSCLELLKEATGCAPPPRLVSPRKPLGPVPTDVMQIFATMVFTLSCLACAATLPVPPSMCLLPPCYWRFCRAFSKPYQRSWGRPSITPEGANPPHPELEWPLDAF